MNGNQEEKDWWDELGLGDISNYEKLLELLMGRFQQQQVGERAYQRAGDWAGQGLAWDQFNPLPDKLFWTSPAGAGAGGTSRTRQRQVSPQQYYASTIEALGSGQLTPEQATGYGQSLDVMSQLVSQGLKEQGIKSPIYQKMISAPFQAGQLDLQEFATALGGLQGFRGQDIDLLLQELQMEMQTSQARAQSGGGGCIVTSACTEAKGLPDDCHELQTLRKLRDWMKGNLDDGNKLVAEYEGLAPAIVEAINERPDAKTVWSRVYDKFIKPAVDLMEQGNNGVAVKVYKDGILELAHEYL